jgi:CubicO group peptidase (beta-lactamase class C family)
MTQSQAIPTSTPEAQGIPSTAILAFVRAAEAHFAHHFPVQGLHSLILLRHGHRIAQGWWSPYGPQHPHELFSLTKSFTSTAVGLAVAEGRLSVEDPVISFFPDDAPHDPSENLAALRVRHLLTMSVGHDEEPSGKMGQRTDGNWVRGFLEHPIPHAPGTHFLYNSAASFMLSAIVSQVTGRSVLDYVQPRLFAPLGIERPAWITCPRGNNVGGWGLSLRTEDIARFGQLYLQRGMWHGIRLLPATWIEAATDCRMPNAPNDNPDWEQNYGYQFWKCRHGAVRGDGAFGQFCILMPEQDAVLAITSGVGDMQAVLDLVWEHLLPAFGAASLPAEPAVQKELEHTLADLAIQPQQGASDSPLKERVSGKTYLLDENEPRIESLQFDFTPDTCTITNRSPNGDQVLTCGHSAWREGTMTEERGIVRKYVASGAWTTEDTYRVQLVLYETPFCPAVTARFAGNQVTYQFEANVGFGPTAPRPLSGRTIETDQN